MATKKKTSTTKKAKCGTSMKKAQKGAKVTKTVKKVKKDTTFVPPFTKAEMKARKVIKRPIKDSTVTKVIKVKKAQKGATISSQVTDLKNKGRRNVEKAPGKTINKKFKANTNKTIKVTAKPSTSVVKPVKLPSAEEKKKSAKKEMQKAALKALKTAPAGSNRRRNLYASLGWKQDATTTGKGSAKSTVKSVKGTKITPAIKMTTSMKKSGVATPTTKQTKKAVKTEVKKTKTSARATKLSNKSQKALSQGKLKKADRLDKRKARVNKRKAK